MKRILHYLILAIVLLGAPALCAWLGGYDEIWEGVKSFPPRTEDWGFQPEKLFDELGITPDWDKLRYYILLDEFF